MNTDIFCPSWTNQISIDHFQVSSETFIENNEFSSDERSYLHDTNNSPLNSYNFPNSLNTIENGLKACVDIDNEKDIKLNIDTKNSNNNTLNSAYPTNIKNNIADCNLLKDQQNITYNDNKLLFEDCLFNFTLNYENNLLNKDDNYNYINLFNENIGPNNLLSIKKSQIDTSNNCLPINNSDSDNDLFINTEIDNILSLLEDEKILDKNFSSDESITKINNNISNINLGKKRILGKRKKENEIIQFGHPKKINYKTIKQKLNIHKKLDLECRNDTFLLMHNISKLKKIIKKKITKNKIKDEMNLYLIENIFKNSILSLHHREYAQDIIGFKFL